MKHLISLETYSRNAYVLRELFVEAWLVVDWRPQLYIIVYTGSGQHRQIRMRLQTIDHVLIRLQQHAQLGGVPLPHEYVTAVAARHDEIVAPEICLLDHGPKETRVKSGGKANDQR